MRALTGPVPDRSDQKVRRNKPEIPIDKVTAIGVVPIPELGLTDAHPLVEDLYQSLTESAQNRYYEPSDWQYARVTMHLLDDLLKAPWAKGAAMKITAINQMMTALLMTEGDRRRVRMEIERDKTDTGNNVINVSDLFKLRLGA
ncbi:hypothetical protein [Mycobacteroides chelonae]|uniref:phage terminase small subunit n=1 Tax=Mycobacteroides chelonae TaxID=1774 RepID=UPI0004AA1CB1|nr:hypothetical protein [Mycobacteroides chelonae]OHT67780.1 hypothetical protein BKG66_24455 [Mycobacteroides chelonae]OHT69423.1 hypothetical protein BKG67_22990 [Mycobacteroides chelonae]